MPDKRTCLLEAEEILHRLEMQVEQYQLHVESSPANRTRLIKPVLSSTG